MILNRVCIYFFHADERSVARALSEGGREDQRKQGEEQLVAEQPTP
jgi:hypothetical protein